MDIIVLVLKTWLAYLIPIFEATIITHKFPILTFTNMLALLHQDLWLICIGNKHLWVNCDFISLCPVVVNLFYIPAVMSKIAVISFLNKDALFMLGLAWLYLNTIIFLYYTFYCESSLSIKRKFHNYINYRFMYVINENFH